MTPTDWSFESVSEFDKKHMAAILGGDGDWFSAELYRLIAKADGNNKARLRLGFPLHVQAYEDYLNGKV